jgi:hypothetical protein
MEDAGLPIVPGVTWEVLVDGLGPFENIASSIGCKVPPAKISSNGTQASSQSVNPTDQ